MNVVLKAVFHVVRVFSILILDLIYTNVLMKEISQFPVISHGSKFHLLSRNYAEEWKHLELNDLPIAHSSSKNYSLWNNIEV